MTLRGAALVAAAVTLVAGVPADAAPRRTTVSAPVAGAVVARVTVTRPVTFLLGVAADGPTAYYGAVVGNVGRPGYALTFRSRAVEPQITAMMGMDDGDGLKDDLRLRPGTYDLTLFSAQRRRVRVTFGGPVRVGAFRPVAMPAWTFTDADPAPAWHGRGDLTLAKDGRGFFSVIVTNWAGTGHVMQATCTWQTTPCNPVEPDQLLAGDAAPGGRWAVSWSATYGNAQAGRTNVELMSLVGGAPASRAAFVLTVP